MSTTTSTGALVRPVTVPASTFDQLNEVAARNVHAGHALPPAHGQLRAAVALPTSVLPTPTQRTPVKPLPVPAITLAERSQRFYPAQWQRLIAPQVNALANNRQQQIDWLGWDRSLPRMYLSVDALSKLVIESVDLITSQSPGAGSARSAGSVRSATKDNLLSLRVVWQVSLQALVLELEHPQWQCEPVMSSLLNAHTLPGATIHAGSMRLMRCAANLGANLSVSAVLGGGTLLRICLPIDSPQALVRRWMQSLSRQTLQRSMIKLYVVGRGAQENVLELAAADVRLQSLARPGDMVYRVGYGRWLWLTVHNSLPGFVQPQAWQSHSVRQWQLPNGPAHVCVAMQDEIVISVAEQMSRLMSRHIPPLDALNRSTLPAQAATARRAIKRASPQPNHLELPSHYESQSRLDAHSPLPAPAHLSNTNRLQPRRWRYPI